MSLATYSKKRNFKETPEPGATVAKGKGANTFVIQRHNATRLHYDFRLEVNGVLKSWAIPKGPSLNPTDKRLAVMVEDHPLSYASFKGTIPEGNYGAGIVEIWDKGTYVPEEMDNISDKEIEKHIKAGMLKFSLKGSKIKGSFALVRIKGADSRNWLLIKHRDKYATDKAYSSEDETASNSRINRALKLNGRGAAASTKNKTGKSVTSTKAGVTKAAAKKATTKTSGIKTSGAKTSGIKTAGTKKADAKTPPTKKAGTKKVTPETPGTKAAIAKTANTKKVTTKSPATKTATAKRANTKNATKPFSAKSTNTSSNLKKN